MRTNKCERCKKEKRSVSYWNVCAECKYPSEVLVIENANGGELNAL